MTVPIGEPITTGQATMATLRLLQTDLVDLPALVAELRYPGAVIEAIRTTTYPALSSGEKIIVDIAWAIWVARNDTGASIGALGGLDPTNRRKVILILAYLHLGHDYPLDGFGVQEHMELFG